MALALLASNLARHLVDLGANVTLVDSLIPDYGGNRFNIAGYEERLTGQRGRRARPVFHARLGPGQAVIFNLAGQVSHMDSMSDPFTGPGDQRAQPALDSGSLPLREPHGHKIVYAGTRQQYGKPPAISRWTRITAGADRHQRRKQAGRRVVSTWVYHSAYGLRTCSLRLTNTYGPRQLVKTRAQGFIRAWFVRLAVEGKTIRGLRRWPAAPAYSTFASTTWWMPFCAPRRQRHGERHGAQPGEAKSRSACWTWRNSWLKLPVKERCN